MSHGTRPGSYDAALMAVAALLWGSSFLFIDVADEALAPSVDRMAGVLERFRASRDWIDARIAAAGPALRAVLEVGLRRISRIQTSFSSIGFDAANPSVLLAELDALSDSRVQQEVALVVAELEWRMREVERETRLRGGMLPAAEAAVVDELVTRLKAPAQAVR